MQTVLTIAGSDNLAGGGIQADLKTFEELDTFGVSALTSVVNVTPNQVKLHPLPEKLLQEQLTSTLTQLPIHYAKTGLIGDSRLISIVADSLYRSSIYAVIDPVIIFKEGITNLHTNYIDHIKTDLLPLGQVITPNLREAEVLSGISQISTRQQMVTAATRIQALGCPNVVIKGGSRLPGDTSYDYLLSQEHEYWFSSPKLPHVIADGAGCTFSAAITAQLANGSTLPEAVKFANHFVHLAIQQRIPINKNLSSVWQGAYRHQEALS